MGKITREKYKTYENVFDEFTYRNLHKLITQGYFEGLIGQIELGKEANVFTAQTKDGGLVIVKIYRLETCDFGKMYSYIKPDPRYNNIKKNKRAIIFSWAQREYRNLLKAREGGVSVPKPINCLHNILVMEFIGENSAAPMVKDHHPKNPKKFFDAVLDNMKKLNKAKLVHADLSCFNILNHNEKPVFIDFSQSTPTENPHAQEFLQRDVKNIANFFNKIGLKVDKEKIIQKL